MCPKPRLSTQVQLKQGLSPQLHHSIRLMSLTSIELQAEIQQALEDNPFLESAPVAEIWEPVHLTAGPGDKVSAQFEDNITFEGLDEVQSLQSYLRWQAELTPFTPDERILAELIIESINEEGYLSAPLHEILPDDLDDGCYELAHIVLHRIQQFDPAGVGAQDLRECLLLQVNQLDPQDPLVQKSCEVLTHHFDKVSEYPEVFSFIQGLYPKPGLLYGKVDCETITPDLIVKQEESEYQVYLNEALMSPVTLNQNYAAALRNSEKSNPALDAQLTAAKSLIYHLSLRHHTLLSVARCIVKAQQGFFHHGPTALKPLKLDEISYTTNLHPSTVSRLTCNKYIHTPQGLFALKYFLSGSVSSQEGETSSKAVQALIKEWVKQEDKAKPLTDQDLMDKLKERGILIARRTVAKYRETLGIPTKSLRRLKI